MCEDVGAITVPHQVAALLESGESVIWIVQQQRRLKVAALAKEVALFLMIAMAVVLLILALWYAPSAPCRQYQQFRCHAVRGLAVFVGMGLLIVAFIIYAVVCQLIAAALGHGLLTYAFTPYRLITFYPDKTDQSLSAVHLDGICAKETLTGSLKMMKVSGDQRYVAGKILGLTTMEMWRAESLINSQR